MDKATYRILDVLSRGLGTPISINEITKNIDKIYGGTYYANTYQKIKELDREKVLVLKKVGGSDIISLNFDNYMVIGMLAEMELWRKHNFLKGQQEMQTLMQEIDVRIRGIPLLSHTLLMYPEKNTDLNKVEILICLKKSNDTKTIKKTMNQIHAITKTLQKSHSIKTNYLVLDNQTFLDLIKSKEHNTVREMLHDKIVVLHPEDFWLEIKSMTEKGIKLSAIQH